MTATRQSVTGPEAVASRQGYEERVQPVAVFGMDTEPDGMGREFLPDRGTIHYRRRLGEHWEATVRLAGPRVMSTGVVSSRSRAERTYWMPAEAAGYSTRREVPKFLRTLVNQYCPPR